MCWGGRLFCTSAALPPGAHPGRVAYFSSHQDPGRVRRGKFSLIICHCPLESCNQVWLMPLGKKVEQCTMIIFHMCSHGLNQKRLLPILSKSGDQAAGWSNFKRLCLYKYRIKPEVHQVREQHFFVFLKPIKQSRVVLASPVITPQEEWQWK